MFLRKQCQICTSRSIVCILHLKCGWSIEPFCKTALNSLNKGLPRPWVFGKLWLVRKKMHYYDFVSRNVVIGAEKAISWHARRLVLGKRGLVPSAQHCWEKKVSPAEGMNMRALTGYEAAASCLGSELSTRDVSLCCRSSIGITNCWSMSLQVWN